MQNLINLICEIDYLTIHHVQMITSQFIIINHDTFFKILKKYHLYLHNIDNLLNMSKKTKLQIKICDKIF
jgi:hypothetical protein